MLSTYKECIMHVEDHELCGQWTAVDIPGRQLPWIPSVPACPCCSSHQEVEFVTLLLESGLALWLALTSRIQQKGTVSFTSGLEED